MKKIFFLLLFLLAVFLNFFNLKHTARYTRDESSDLVSIQQIYQKYDLTLIGPRSEGGLSIFSSLTYYLLLPFCILFNFDPLAPVYGTAFYGLLTITIFWIILKKKFSLSILILSLIFTPFLASFRSAWNPHLIPFWQSLFLLTIFSTLPYKYLFAGLLMGFTIHQHWYAFFTTIALIPVLFFLYRKIKPLWQYLLGLLISISPFIIFDLTHPPGLFITRFLYFSPVSASSNPQNLFSLFQKFIDIIIKTFTYFSGNNYYLGIIVLFLTVIILIKNKKEKTNFWLLPLFFQATGITLTQSLYADRYLLPSAIFFLFWLSQINNTIYRKILIFVLIISNLLNLPKLLFFTDWSSNIQAQKQITNFIVDDQKETHPFNLVVLQSPDGNTKGLRFRDQLKLKNIEPKDENDYQNIDILYIISYQKDWSSLSKDPSYEIDNFRSLKPELIYPVEDSDWNIYKLSKSTNKRL